MTTQPPHLSLLLHQSLLGHETGDAQGPVREGVQRGDFDYIIRRALLVEEAGFDGILYGDGPSFGQGARKGYGPFGFEPFTLLSAIAARTTRLGVIATASTTFNDPYQLARRFASIDRFSGGRAAWNVVTGTGGARNFGTAAFPPPAERYERATEFVEVVLKLWNSWKPGYLNADPSSGSVLNADRIIDIQHHGRFYDVHDAIGVPPSPQGHPVVVEAGSSGPGIELGARYGEVIYIAAPTFEHAVDITSQYRAKAPTYGRAPDAIKFAPGLFAYIGETREEAQAARNALFDDEEVWRGLGRVKSEYSGFDFPGYELDDLLRPEDLPTEEDILAGGGRRSRALLFLEFAKKPGATLRSLLLEAESGHGHTILVGTYDDVADELERWYRAGVADAFVLMGTNSLEKFIDEVMARLERKGIFRQRPELTTFRDRLGLPPVGVLAETLSAPASEPVPVLA